MTRDKTRERARGRWLAILQALGVPAKLIDGKHQSCPRCGGKDRFRFIDYDGTGGYICTRCGAGSGFDLLMMLRGWDFRTAAAQVERIVGACAPDKKPPERDEAMERAAMNRLWSMGKPLASDDASGRYLWQRCRVTVYPACLRFVAKLQCAGAAEAYPAMLAKVTAPNDDPCTIHRTYLTSNGGKAPVEAPRRMMPGVIAKGAAVRLTLPAAVLGIAEGIETALSATELTGISCWAALNASMLRTWEPPKSVTRVVIFADNDKKFTGQAAAYDLAHRLSTKGYDVDVRVPGGAGEDWNDVHCNGKRA